MFGVADTLEFIAFLEQGFGAKKMHVYAGPDGKIFHAEFRIGDSVVMVGGCEPRPYKMNLYVYVPDVDSVFRQLIEAGATAVTEPKTQFYGDRMGTVHDKWGNAWTVSTHVEDVEPAEMERRSQAAMAEYSAQTTQKE
jgi:uncharacterized glyoxalase superfamily protein PhnB